MASVHLQVSLHFGLERGRDDATLARSGTSTTGTTELLPFDTAISANLFSIQVN
jgi:hypothetical protein